MQGRFFFMERIRNKWRYICASLSHGDDDDDNDDDEEEEEEEEEEDGADR